MKNLSEFINEQSNTINEGAFDIINGILGYKMVNAFFDLFGSMIQKPIIRKNKIKLEKCQNEMIQILSKYPGSQERFEKELYVRLHSKTTGSGIILSIERHPELLNNSLDDFSEDDRNRFMALYNEVAKIQDEVFSNINTMDIHMA